MDDDRIFVRIVVEDDLEQSTRSIRADDEIPPFAGTIRSGFRTAWLMSSSRTPCLRALSAIST
jgi:hypothetical protein